jgi:formylglycine-generating enzyme required for sulfatase activity
MRSLRTRARIGAKVLLACGLGFLLSSCLDPEGEPPPPPPPGFEFVPAGSFRMGRPDDPFDPTHGTRRVTLRRPFLLARHEVTLGEYLPALNRAWRRGDCRLWDEWLWDGLTEMPLLRLTRSTGIVYEAAADSFALAGSAGASLPATHLSWYGAAAYCDWRNVDEGLPASYERHRWDWFCGPDGDPYAALGWRLPTEAEWEFAARFPDDRQYPWGNSAPDCDRVNGRIGPGADPCGEGVWPVGSGSPRGDARLGIADLAGNVAEWCQDWHGEWATHEPLVDPVDVDAGDTFKSLRGGAFAGPFDDLSTWTRARALPEDAAIGQGLRLARSWTY